MDLQFERTIVQNPAFGATAIWQFARAYFDTRGQTLGPQLPVTLLVLPMVMHRRTAMAIHRMNSESGLARALLVERELPVGLQRRLEGYVDLSFAAIDLGIASTLLEIDPDRPWPRYVPQPKKVPGGSVGNSDDVRMILNASKRLGWWFANEELLTLCSLLNVRF